MLQQGGPSAKQPVVWFACPSTIGSLDPENLVSEFYGVMTRQDKSCRHFIALEQSF